MSNDEIDGILVRNSEMIRTCQCEVRRKEVYANDQVSIDR